VRTGRAGACARDVSAWLAGHANGELDHDACLLVSELVTNCVMHAGQTPGAPLEVRSRAWNGVVRFEVEDQGHSGAVARRAPDGDGGFGLQLVELLAARWGVSHDHGMLVWFELPNTAPASRR
jgi:anti-sigma regulatory factor (Ser/Thr protein kinase)